MALKETMQNVKQNAAMREAAGKKLFANDRKFRMAKALEAWKTVPEIGEGLDKYDESTQENTAMYLSQQMHHMKRMTETVFSQNFQSFSPENMLRLVRLSMPNCIRSKAFTEFALETMRDSMKLARPVYKKPASKSGSDMANRHTKYGQQDADGNDITDPWQFDHADPTNDINEDGFRRALYQTTEDRFVQSLANVKNNGGKFVFAYDKDVDANDGINFGEKSKYFIDGYTTFYYGDETHPVAIQNKRTLKFMYNTEEFGDNVQVTETKAEDGTVSFEIKGVVTKDGTDVSDKVSAFARYEDEQDLDGDYLGEVDIRFSDYFFSPKRTSIGVTWSQLSEITLDVGFGVSAEEYLISYASQEIRVALDYRAFKLAYANARTNPAAYHVEFDAAYNTTNVVPGSTGTKDSYIENALTFNTAIEKLSDTMLNDINIGGVNTLICGPSAGTYLTLNPAYSAKGKMVTKGCHVYGTFDNSLVIKVPSSIIPTNEILTTFKNPEQENDVGVIFGTLVPFYSTGVIQRRNFYKEAGLSTYGDWNVLNKKYLGIIRILNLKDQTVN